MSKRKVFRKQLCLRVEREVYDEWVKEAAAAGVTVSILIRLRMAGREVVTTRKAA